MSWKGRILGAIIGLLFSPIGSVIGFILGYFFYDKSRNQQVKLQSQQQQHAKNSFLEAHYANYAKSFATTITGDTKFV